MKKIIFRVKTKSDTSTISQFHQKPQFNSWAAHQDPKKKVKISSFCAIRSCLNKKNPTIFRLFLLEGLVKNQTKKKIIVKNNSRGCIKISGLIKFRFNWVIKLGKNTMGL